MNMKSKDFGLLCAAITLFTFCGPVQAAGSRMELTIKNYHGCLAAPETSLTETSASAEDPNAAGDNIIGDYLVDHKGEKSKVKVFKMPTAPTPHRSSGSRTGQRKMDLSARTPRIRTSR